MGNTFEDNLALVRDFRARASAGLSQAKSAFELGEGAPDAVSAAGMADIERALTAFMGGLLGLAVDREIFRGAVAPGRDGCAVSVNRLEVSRDEALPTVYALFECRDADRDRVMELTSALASRFPVNGMGETLSDGTAVTARRIDVVSAEITVGRADNGRIKTFGFISFKVQL